MSEEEKRDGSGFKVTDRRLFTSEGELRPKDLEEDPPEPEAEQTAGDSETKNGPSVIRDPEETASPVDLSSLVLSLATTAMVHLGDVRDPSGEVGKPDLGAARQMVEILSMLQRKTEGNRTAEETRLLDDVLYELRMRILAKTGAAHL